jgi:hypothetical protein
MVELFSIQYASRTELVAVTSHMVVRIVDGHRTTTADFDRLDATVTRELAASPVFGVLQVVCHGTPPAPPPIRRHGAQLMERYAERSCVVVALLGLGFWTSALRTAIVAFTTLLRTTHIHLEDSVEAAAERLASELVGLNPEELVAAFTELHDHMRTLPK